MSLDKNSNLDAEKFVDSLFEESDDHENDEELNGTPENVPRDHENEVLIRTPEKLSALANAALSETIPKASSKRYERSYTDFTKWLKSNGTSHISERTVLAYFEETSRKKAPSSLWSCYSMMKSTIRLNHDIDISKYPTVTAFLKQKYRGYKPRKAMIFREEELAQFLTEAPDSQFLAVKVAAIISLCGCLRMNELIHVLVEHITEKPDMYLFDIPTTKNLTARSFPVMGNWFHTIKKYQVLRPESLPDGRFFVRYQDGKCAAQFIGENTMKAMPKKIAEYLQLPNAKDYTGHSFRRSSASVAANDGADTAMLKRLGGWMSEKVANSYVEESINYKKKTSNLIMSSIVSVQNMDDKRVDPAVFENPSAEVVLSQQHTLQVNNRREIMTASNSMYDNEIQVVDNRPEMMKASNSIPQSVEKEKNVDIMKAFNFTNCQVTINFNK